MKTLTVAVLVLGVVCGMNSPNKHVMRFTELSDLLINQEEMYRKVSLCNSVPKRVVDSTGHSWPNFCYQSSSGSEFEIVFTRLYSGDNWTYAIDQDIGYPEFQFRVIEHIKPCLEETEKDGTGLVWTVWRYVDGRPVLFQRKNTTSAWTYVEDKEGGIRECQYRRILHENGRKEDQFEETPWTFFWDVFGLDDEDETDWAMRDLDEVETEIKGDLDEVETGVKGDLDEAETRVKGDLDEVESDWAKEDLDELETDLGIGGLDEVVLSPIVSTVPAPSVIPTNSSSPDSTHDCYPLETDVSDRYFWTQFDAAGKKVDFERDSRGVFLISNLTHLRVPIAQNVTEDAAIESRHIALACPVNGTNGQQTQFQPDEEIAGIYWVEDGVQYQYSVTEADKAFGMYILDGTSGKRIPVAGGSGST